MQGYSYPLADHWSTEEIITVVAYYQAVEQAYEEGIAYGKFEEKYQAFKEIVTSIGEEKRLTREFEKLSGYQSYQAVKEMRRLKEEKYPRKTKIKIKQRSRY